MANMIIYLLLINLCLFGHGGRVYGQRLNLASPTNGATCSSSNPLDETTDCTKAIDGREDSIDSEFITDRQGEGTLLTINFANSSTVNELRILQRCNIADKTAEINIQYSDGSSITVPLSCAGTSEYADQCDDTEWESIPLPSSVTTSSVTITTTAVCSIGAFNGYREVVALGQFGGTSDTNLALSVYGVTCEASTEHNPTQTCQNAIDGFIDPTVAKSWAAAPGDNVGSWLKLSLPRTVEVRKIRVKNRCLLLDQMRTVLIEYDDGSSQSMSLNCYNGTDCCSCPEQIWNEIDVPSTMTSSVKITGTETCSPTTALNGFQEVEIMGPADFEQRINLAAPDNGATCSSSSQLDETTNCDKAIDGREDPRDSEFITDREGDGTLLTINFASLSVVDELRILQRCNIADKTAEVQVQLSEGSPITVPLSCAGTSESGLQCDDTNWESIPLTSAVTASSITINTTAVCSIGAFNGYREVVALGHALDGLPETNLALLENGGTCETSSDRVASYTCQFAIDGVIGAGDQQCWASQINDVIGSWLKISLPSRSQVRKIRVKNRCLLTEQMKTVLLEFDDGSSQQMSLNCYDGAVCCSCPEQIWDEINVPNVVTSSVKITGIETCDPATIMNGFQEIEITGAAVPVAGVTCPSEFHQPLGLSSCYKFVTSEGERVHKAQAQAACSSLHPKGHLVEVNSDVEQDYLARTAQTLNVNGETCGYYHTNGYRHDDGDVEWFWQSTEERVVLPHWGPAMPDNVAGHNSLLLAAYPSDGLSGHWEWVNGDPEQSQCYICEI